MGIVKPKPLLKLTERQQKDLGVIRSHIVTYGHHILNGTFVSIDPSCASRSSQPGYAVFDKCQFVEGGVLDIKYKPQLSYRIQAIRELVAREFVNHVDLLLIEETPVRPIRTKAGAAAGGQTYMNFRSIASLKMACGAIIAAFPVGFPVINIPASLWTKIAHNAGFKWEKGDAMDARLMGESTIILAEQIVNGIDN